MKKKLVVRVDISIKVSLSNSLYSTPSTSITIGKKDATAISRRIPIFVTLLFSHIIPFGQKARQKLLF